MGNNFTLSTWEDILEDFIKEFKNQKFGKDQKIPTENESAIKYGVNRSEIRIVYKKLKELGYIYSVQGCGSFCSGKRIKIPLSMTGGKSFSAKMNNLDLSYKTENTNSHAIRYNPFIYDSLQAAPEETIWKINLLRFVDDEPVALHTRYLPERLFPSLLNDASTISSSRDYLKDNGYPNVHSFDAQMIVTPISKKKQALLNMQYKQEAIVLTGKTIDATNNSILELFCTTYRSDYFMFTFN